LPLKRSTEYTQGLRRCQPDEAEIFQSLETPVYLPFSTSSALCKNCGNMTAIDSAVKYWEDCHTIENQLRTEDAQRPDLIIFRTGVFFWAPPCASLWPFVSNMRNSVFGRRSNKTHEREKQDPLLLSVIAVNKCH
jgi:hypothetical protein